MATEAKPAVQCEVKRDNDDSKRVFVPLPVDVQRRLHFLLLDLKYAEKDKRASARLVARLETAVYPSSYLSSMYVDSAVQTALLERRLADGRSLRAAFDERFVASGVAPCGPHGLAPWYAHHLRLGKPSRTIKTQYAKWAAAAAAAAPRAVVPAAVPLPATTLAASARLV